MGILATYNISIIISPGRNNTPVRRKEIVKSWLLYHNGNVEQPTDNTQEIGIRFLDFVLKYFPPRIQYLNRSLEAFPEYFVRRITDPIIQRRVAFQVHPCAGTPDTKPSKLVFPSRKWHISPNIDKGFGIQ